jgi:hypothetical protein
MGNGKGIQLKKKKTQLATIHLTTEDLLFWLGGNGRGKGKKGRGFRKNGETNLSRIASGWKGGVFFHPSPFSRNQHVSLFPGP